MNERAKAFLKRAKQLDQKIICHKRRIKTLETDLQEIRSNMTTIRGVSYPSVKVQTSRTLSGEDRLIALLDREQRIVDQIVGVWDQIRDVEQEHEKIVETINKLDDGLHSEILYERYILHKDFMQISEDIALSYSRCTHVHIEALSELEEILGND